jgi:hypothetical protein
VSNGAYNLQNAALSNAYLVKFNLANADGTNATLTEAKQAGANLSGANLTQALLQNANLSGASLSNANLSQAHQLLFRVGGRRGPLPRRGRRHLHLDQVAAWWDRRDTLLSQRDGAPTDLRLEDGVVYSNEREIRCPWCRRRIVTTTRWSGP